MVESALRANREDFDMAFGNSPDSVDPTGVGARFLVWHQNGKLRIRSLTPGKDELRVYPFDRTAKFLTSPLGLIHRLDRESFLAYVYNYGNIVVDMTAGTKTPVSPEEAAALRSQAVAKQDETRRDTRIPFAFRVSANAR
jgi:hypothetical protein